MPDQFTQRPQPGQPERRSDPFGDDPTEPMIELPPGPQPLALPPPHGDVALPQGTFPAQPLPGTPVPNWPPGAPPPPWQPGPLPTSWQSSPSAGQSGTTPASWQSNPPAGQSGTPATPWQRTAPTNLLPPVSGPYQASWPPVSGPYQTPAYPTALSQSQPSIQGAAAAGATLQGQPPSLPPKARRGPFTSRRAQITLMASLVLLIVCVLPLSVFGIWGWWSGQRHQPPPVLATLRVAGQSGNQLAWSPDGKYLAEQITLPGGTTGDPKGAAVIIWDAASGQQLRRFTGTDGGLAFAWSPDGTLLATSNGSHTLIWRAQDITVPGNTAGPVALLNGYSKYDQISALAFSKDVQILAVADDGGVDIFQAGGSSGWKQLLYVPDSLCATTPCTRALSWSPDGSWLLAAPWHLSDGTSGVGALDTQTWKQAAFLDASAPLAWSPDSSDVLLRASDETTLSALHTGNWTADWSLNPNTDIHQGYNVYPQAAGWSPDNEWLVCSADGWVDLWPLSTHTSTWVWNEQRPGQHIYTVNSLVWSPDSQTLALTTDGTANVTLYDMSNPSPPLL